MNRKLNHWATLIGKNNHCNNNRSPVMTPQRTVAVFSVAIHASPWQPFLKISESRATEWYMAGSIIK